MPRKKKKNAAASTRDNGTAESGTKDVDVLKINQSFAEKYETAKRKELLANLPADAFDDESCSEDEEDEDEHAVLLTKKMDRLVQETIAALRSKDPSIYDKNVKFFENEQDEDAHGAEDSDSSGSDSSAGSEVEREYDSDDEPVAGWEAVAQAAETEATKGLTLKDYVRENLLADGRLSDSESEDDPEMQLDESRKGAERKVRFEGTAASTVLAHARGTRRTALGSPEEKELLVGDLEGGDVDEGSEKEEDGDEFFKKKEKSELELLKEDKDFDKFLKKEIHSKRNHAGDEMLLHAYLERETPDEKERFLQDFVLNNGWLDKSAGAAPFATDYSIEVDKTDTTRPLRVAGDAAGDAEQSHADDSDFEDKVDEFEHNYNFRFEEPDGAKVISHARHIEGSLRRPDDRRKRAREARKLRREHEKIVKTEDIKQLKNLKSREIEARLVALREAAGDGVDFSGIDLDADFDPEKFSKEMEAQFGDEYYSVKDKDMKAADDDGVANATTRLQANDIEPDVAEDVNRLVEAYYNLDYEDIIGGTPVRFEYKKVDSETFGMDVKEILESDDKELNRKASLKYLAPYRKGMKRGTARWQSRDTERDLATKIKRKRSFLQAGGDRTNDRIADDHGTTLIKNEDQASQRKRRKAQRRGSRDGTTHNRANDDSAVKSEPSPLLDDRAAATGFESLPDTEHISNTAPGNAESLNKRKKKTKKQRRMDRHEEAASSLTSSRRAAYGIS